MSYPVDMDTARALLPYVKSQLQVTWQDEATDERYIQMIADGMAYIDSKLPCPGDYTLPGAEREMVKEYVRYTRDAALDVFENNYMARLLAMQHERKLELYVGQMDCAAAAAHC